MECFREYYIHNYKLKPCSDFDESIISKGISVYEVIRIESGFPIFLEDHLNRLFHSAEIINLTIDESYCDFESLIDQLIKTNKINRGKIKLVIHFNTGNEKHEKDLLVYFTPHYFPSTDEYKKGVKVGLCKAVRSHPNAKILNTEARKKANNTIVEERLFEVLLVDEDGFITEGSRSNIFFIKDNKVITPPEKDVLVGIARKNIKKICKSNNIEFIEKKIHYSMISGKDSIFLTGTSLKVLPVGFLEEFRYNTKNELLKKLMKLYDKSIQEYILSKKLT